MCQSFLPVAEDAHSYALPIARAHREGIAYRDEVSAVCAIGELMLIATTVIGHAEIDFRHIPRFHQRALSVALNEQALRTESDAKKLFARSEQPREAVAAGLHQCGALTSIAYNFLCKHVATSLQAVSRKGMQRQPPISL